MFTVRWKRSARDELTTLWLNADPTMRQAVTAASNQIDVTLRRTPLDVGESRGGTDRVWFPFPFGVRYSVDEDNRVVRVLQVWQYRRRS